MSTNFRTPYCPITTTVDRELIAVYREINAGDRRILGRFHRDNGHRGSASRCNLCRNELRKRREEQPVIITTPDAEATA